MFKWFTDFFADTYVWKLYRYFPETDQKAYITITAYGFKSMCEIMEQVTRYEKDGWVVKSRPITGE